MTYLLLIIAVFFLINILLIIFFNKIVTLINVYDYPDSQRKIHSSKTPVIGGIIVLINLVLLFITKILFYDQLYFWNETLNTYRELYSFFVTSILLFLVGIYDDKNTISPNIKLLAVSFIIYFGLLIDPSLVLNDIKFSFRNEIIDLKNANVIITLLCFLLFINAYNMIDGIDLLAGIYAIILFLYLIFNDLYLFPSLIMISSLLIFLYFNSCRRTFFGDNGTLLTAYILSFMFIKGYNTDLIKYADSVVLLMLIPGLDLFRLAVERLYNNTNPFKPDRQHLHHLLLANLNNRVFCLISILSIIFLPYLFSLFIISNLASIILSTILYVFLIFLLRYYEK